MSKTVRIVLYVLSILTVIGVIAAFVFTGGGKTTMVGVTVVTTDSDEASQPDMDRVGQPDADRTGKVASDKTGNADTDRAGQSDTDEAGNAYSDKISKPDTSPDRAGKGDSDRADNADPDIAGNADSDTTILFTGDVLFANAFQAGYDAKGIEGVVSPEVLKELKSADILMINNEFPFSSRGTQMEDKQFTFRCAPSYVKALNEMGVDVVSLANNHTLDYGREALSDTFQTLDGAGILYGGAGESVERAEALQVLEVNGKKFGFLAVSRVIPVASWKVEQSTPGIFSCYDETRLVELVAEAKKECDFVAVYPHWGVEYAEYPETYQTKIAEKCIEAGADMVAGSHTHCLQGIEFMDGKPVFYSLGNFIFGRDIDRSAMVKVTVTPAGEASYELIPVYAAGGVTQFPETEKAVEILNYIGRISTGASVSSDGKVLP